MDLYNIINLFEKTKKELKEQKENFEKQKINFQAKINEQSNKIFDINNLLKQKEKENQKEKNIWKEKENKYLEEINNKIFENENNEKNIKEKSIIISEQRKKVEKLDNLENVFKNYNDMMKDFFENENKRKEKIEEEYKFIENNALDLERLQNELSKHKEQF